MISIESGSYSNLLQVEEITKWLSEVIEVEGYELAEVSYSLVSDVELYRMNVEYLQHDTLTDIITFDYTIGKLLQADIFISAELTQMFENCLSN